MRNPSLKRRLEIPSLLQTWLPVVVSLCVVTSAHAHPGHYHPPDEVDEFDSFTAGFLHPFTGLDHALLAIAIGWLVMSRFDRAGILQSVSFLASLLGGAFIGRFTGATLGLEAALACTVLCGGALFLFPRLSSSGLIHAVAICAGLIHGVAHGSELASVGGFASLMFGILTGTAVLLSVGALMGHGSAIVRSTMPPRIAGAALFASGLVFLWHAI